VTGVSSAPVSNKPVFAEKVPSAMMGGWKLKDNVIQWGIGSLAASEMKTLTLMLKDKGILKKGETGVLKAVLKSGDKTVMEAAPVTLQWDPSSARNLERPATPTPELSTPTPVPPKKARSKSRLPIATPTPPSDY
jgi:hypothetical protein